MWAHLPFLLIPSLAWSHQYLMISPKIYKCSTMYWIPDLTGYPHSVNLLVRHLVLLVLVLLVPVPTCTVCIPLDFCWEKVYCLQDMVTSLDYLKREGRKWGMYRNWEKKGRKRLSHINKCGHPVQWNCLSPSQPQPNRITTWWLCGSMKN